MLGADKQRRAAGLGAGFEPFDEHVARRDRRRVGYVAGHLRGIFRARGDARLRRGRASRVKESRRWIAGKRALRKPAAPAPRAIRRASGV